MSLLFLWVLIITLAFVAILMLIGFALITIQPIRVAIKNFREHRVASVFIAMFGIVMIIAIIMLMFDK
jgi:hypothetical protein